MAIATAPVDFDAYDRSSKPTPLDGPALEALKACAELRGASLDALRTLSRQATLRPVGRGATVARPGDAAGRRDSRWFGDGFAPFAGRPTDARSRSRCFAPAIWSRTARSAGLPLGNDWEAVESSTLLMIPREVLMACLRADARTSLLALAAGLCARLERSKQLATGLALSGVQERVVSRLVALGRQDGAAGAGGVAHPQPAHPAGAGQSDRRLPGDRVPDGIRAGPAGAADAARPVAAGEQAAGRRQRLTLRPRAS